MERWWTRSLLVRQHGARQNSRVAGDGRVCAGGAVVVVVVVVVMMCRGRVQTTSVVVEKVSSRRCHGDPSDFDESQRGGLMENGSVMQIRLGLGLKE